MKLVIFDVDGTLVDSQAQILRSMGLAFEGLGMVPPAREAVLGIVGLSLPQAMARLVPGADEGLLGDLVQGYKNSFQIQISDGPAPLFPGALDALHVLASRDDLRLGVATGKSRRGLDHLLNAYGLTGLFVTTQVADDHPSKPHPSMVLTAMQQAGVAPENTVMIGDTTFDIDMGLAAQARAIGVSWGYHPATDLRHADAVIDSFAELDATLARIWGQA